MTEEMKKDCYESYVDEVRYEWGDYVTPITYEEYCKECDEYGWDLI